MRGTLLPDRSEGAKTTATTPAGPTRNRPAPEEEASQPHPPMLLSRRPATTMSVPADLLLKADPTNQDVDVVRRRWEWTSYRRPVDEASTVQPDPGQRVKLKAAIN